jgi:hypothetical protein
MRAFPSGRQDDSFLVTAVEAAGAAAPLVTSAGVVWAKRPSDARTVAIGTRTVTVLYIQLVHCNLYHRPFDSETTDSSTSFDKFIS